MIFTTATFLDSVQNPEWKNEAPGHFQMFLTRNFSRPNKIYSDKPDKEWKKKDNDQIIEIEKLLFYISPLIFVHLVKFDMSINSLF